MYGNNILLFDDKARPLIDAAGILFPGQQPQHPSRILGGHMAQKPPEIALSPAVRPGGDVR